MLEIYTYVHNAEQQNLKFLVQRENSLSVGMTAVVVAIAHKHTFRFDEQSLYSQAKTDVDDHHLPRARYLKWEQGQYSWCGACFGTVSGCFLICMYPLVRKGCNAHKNQIRAMLIGTIESESRDTIFEVLGAMCVGFQFQSFTTQIAKLVHLLVLARAAEAILVLTLLALATKV